MRPFEYTRLTKNQANKVAMRWYKEGKVVVMYREPLTHRCSGHSYRVEVREWYD